MDSLFSFPDPVNETSARIVALGVVAMATAFLLTGQGWILAPLVYGFAARVLTGPTLSPLGQFSVRVATPWVEDRFGVESRRVPGPPKRFAQVVGLMFSSVAAIAWLAGFSTVAYAVLGALVVAASLEALASICLGCAAYSAIWGCADCNDISDRLAAAVAETRRPTPVA